MPTCLQPSSEARSRGAERAAGVRRVRSQKLERLLELAACLPAEERRLLELVYRQGVPVAALARLGRVPESTLRKRLAALLRRMHAPLFGFLVSQDHVLPQETRRVAGLVVLRGCSLRDAARRLNLPLHRVREQMIALHALTRT